MRWRTAATLVLIACAACRRSSEQETLRLAMSRQAIDLSVGDTTTLQPVVIVSSQEAPTTVYWSSDNDAIAHVDQHGLVTARAPGTASITARIGTAFASTRVSVSLARKSAAAATHVSMLLRRQPRSRRCCPGDFGALASLQQPGVRNTPSMFPSMSSTP